MGLFKDYFDYKNKTEELEKEIERSKDNKSYWFRAYNEQCDTVFKLQETITELRLENTKKEEKIFKLKEKHVNLMVKYKELMDKVLND